MLIPLKFVVMLIPNFKYKEHSESFVMILGFELFVAVPGMLFFMISTCLSLGIEYFLFAPRALTHAVEGTSNVVTKWLDPRGLGWTPWGATAAFLIGVPLVALGWIIQVTKLQEPPLCFPQQPTFSIHSSLSCSSKPRLKPLATDPKS